MNNDTTALLVQLGIQYVESGGIQRAKAELTSLAAAAKAASGSAGATIAQAAAQAQVMAGQLYNRAVQSLVTAGRGALTTLSAWSSSFGNQFRSTIAGVLLRVAPVISSIGSGIMAATTNLARLVSTGSAALATGFASMGRAIPAIFAGMRTAAASALNGMGAVFSGIGRGVATSLASLGNVVANAARATFGGIAGAGRWAFNAVGNLGRNMAAGYAAGPPLPVGASNGFQNSMNFLTDSFGNATRAATILATAGISALAVQFGVLATGAKKLVEEFVGVNERFQGLEITIKSSLKSPELAREFRDQLAKITAVSPLPYEGIAQLARSLVVIPQTRGRLTDQALAGNLGDPNGFLKKSVLLVEKMLAFRPDKSVTDAVFSIREALGGEFRSLVRRFDIPLTLVSQLAGRSVQDLKTDSTATMDALMTVFDRIISTQSVRERAMQPSVVWQNIKEQIGTVGALAVGDKGIYPAIQKSLGDVYDSVQELTRNRKDAYGEDIKGTSLIERYSKPISDSLVSLLESLKSKLTSIAEDMLGRVGLGQGDVQGASIVERILMGAKQSIDWLSVNLPLVLDKVYNIFSAILPILTKIGSIAINIMDKLATLFSKVPLASLGLMFGPTRMGMLASAGGLSLPASIGLAALSSPGLVRGIGNVLPNYTSTHAGGIGGSFTGSFAPMGTGIGSSTAGVARGLIGGLGTLAVGYIMLRGGIDMVQFLIEDRKNARKEKVAEVVGDAKNLQAWLSQQNPDIQKQVAYAMANPEGRSLGPEDSMRSLDGANPNALGGSLTGTPSLLNKDSLRGLLMNFPDVEKVISAFESDSAIAQYFKTVAENVVQLQEVGAKAESQTREQLSAIKTVKDALESRDTDGGILRNLDEALGSKVFKDSLSGIDPLLSRMQSSTEQAGTQHFKDAFSEYSREVVLMGETWKRVDQFIGERAVTMKMANAIDKLMSNKDGMLQGQTEVKANFQSTFESLKSLAAAKVPLTDQVSKHGLSGLGMTLGEALKHYEDILKSFESGAGDLSEALQDKLREIQVSMQVSTSSNILTSLKVVNTVMEEIVGNIEKGLITQGEPAIELFKRLRESVNALDPKLAALVKPMIDTIENSIPSPVDIDKQDKSAAANIAKEQLSYVQLKLADYVKVLREKGQEIVDQMFQTQGLVNDVKQAPYRTFNGDYFQRNKSGPRVSGGGGSGGAAYANQRALNDSLELPTGGEADILGNNLMTVVEAQKDAEETFRAGAAKKAVTKGVVDRVKKAPAEKRSFDDRALDAAVTNAIQEVSSLLAASDKITKEGPLAESMRSEFKKSMEAFPELAQLTSTSVSTIFAAVKDGESDVDILQKKLSATLEVSTKLAAVLKARAATERGKGNLSMSERYEDSARRLVSESAGIAQQLADLEEKINHPFQSFFKGMAEGVGSTKSLLLQMGQVGVQVSQTLSSHLGSAFASYATGAKSAKEAFADFAQGVVNDLARMAAEAAAKQLLGVLINLGMSALGSYAGGTYSGGSYTPNGGSVAGYSYSSSTGYTAMASGGRVYGGSGVVDDVPAMLMSGEYVLKKSAVDRIGAHNLDAINHYADGGLVGPATDWSSMGGSSSDSSVNINIPITVSGGKDSSMTPEDQKDLSRKLRTAVLSIITEEQRPNGILRRGSGT